MTAEGLAKALGGRKVGAGWMARCPAHDDRNPSLSISRGRDGKILVFCHGLCTQEAVVAALRYRGLWAEDRHRFRRSIVRPARGSYNENCNAQEALQLEKARWYWQHSIPGAGTVVEGYLASRGLPRVPSSLRFLAPTGAHHHPAMIGAFGMPHEPEPSRLFMPLSQVMGVHLTLLRPDGSGKAGTDRDKLMIGPSNGWPIVLAPVNDIGGLAIAEGIEDALSLHRALGVGAYAAGAANRLATLAHNVPIDAECVTVVEDDDAAGRRGASELAERLARRGLGVIIYRSHRMGAAA